MMVGLRFPAMAVIMRAMRENRQAEREVVGQSDYSSEEPSNILELEIATKNLKD